MAENLDNPKERTSSPESEEPNLVEGPDIAAGPSHSDRRDRSNYPDTLPSVSDNPPKREENPFSFKRFLNQDRGGVRRKEFSPDGAPVLINTPEISSVLPDFVQDHLVVEQCYLSSPSHHNPLPFDLPLPADERSDAVPTSLPDFLSDGPIHSQRVDDEAAVYLGGTGLGMTNGLSSVGSLPRNEADRLQREVDSLRRQLMERTRRVEILEAEVSLFHSRDVRESKSLQHALQQTENNLRHTSKCLAASEATVSKLKAENKILKSQLQALEGGQGTGGDVYTFVRNQRLAQDLRGAASAAEVHLRALMSGIDNLRMLAAAVEECADLRDYDDCDEGATGPAL